MSKKFSFPHWAHRAGRGLVTIRDFHGRVYNSGNLYYRTIWRMLLSHTKSCMIAHVRSLYLYMNPSVRAQRNKLNTFHWEQPKLQAKRPPMQKRLFCFEDQGACSAQSRKSGIWVTRSVTSVRYTPLIIPNSRILIILTRFIHSVTGTHWQTALVKRLVKLKRSLPPTQVKFS